MRTSDGIIIPSHFAFYGDQAEVVYLAQLTPEVMARVDAAIAGEKPDAGEPKETAEPSVTEDYW